MLKAEMKTHIYGQVIFDKATKTVPCEKDEEFQESLLRNWMATCERKNLEPYSIYTDSTPKGSRPKHKAQNYKTFEEKHRENIHGTGFYKDF